MIRHSLQCLLALTVWTPYILLTPGCADESAGPATAEGEGEGEGEGSPGIPQCNEGEYCASLEAVEPATVVFGAVQMEQRKIKIRYLKPDPSNPGQQLPIAMAPILWSIEVPGVPMPGAQLGSGSTQTDDQGFSENTVHTGTGEGQLRVTVKAPVAQDLVYTVNVGTKEQGTIEVRVEYPPGGVFVGDNRFTEVMVYAFEHKAGPVACAGLDPSNITGGGTPSWSVPIGLPLPGSASRSFLLKGSRWTLIAIARKAFPETTPVAVASACNEQSGLVTGGQTTKVTLQLTDLRFPYKGRYKAHTFINFMKMLPGDPESCSIFSGDDCGSIEGIVTQVADFFSDPGRFVLVVLEDVIEQQFDIGVPDGFKNVLARLLNSALERLLPGWAQGIFTVGGDLALILQELEVIEYFIFTEEPTPSTSDARLLVFPACAEGQQNCAQWEEWTDICFNWRLGRCEGIDPNDMASGCGRQCFALNDFVAPLDGQPVPSVEGGFNAQVQSLWDLSIDKHSLQLNYGAIIVGVVEKVILPAAAGARSIEEFVFSILGGEHPLTNEPCIEMAGDPKSNCCDSLARRMLDDPSGSSFWSDAAKSVCEDGVPILVDTLIRYLVGNTVDTGGYLQLGTADMFDDIPAEQQKPCRLTFGPNGDTQNPGITLLKLGDKPDDKICHLRAGLKIGDLPIDYAEARFYAEREED